jgi:O-antigen/teichoic acid export membrane protein
VLLRQGLWVAAGHLVAALAVLVGTRLITELAEPKLFGQYALLNGVLALLQGLLFQPLGQAALRFYSEFEASNEKGVLGTHLRDLYSRRSVLVAATLVVLGLIDVVTVAVLPLAAWVGLALGVALESWKTFEVVMRNAAANQRSYALLLATDSVGRPVGALLFAWAFGTSIEGLLFGQVTGTFAALAGVRYLTRDLRVEVGNGNATQAAARLLDMQRFAAPLVWLPVVAWISAMSDRYIVAGLLGISHAGIYAAAYGIASRPLILLGSIADSTFRQSYYRSVANTDRRNSRIHLRQWLFFNVGLGTLTFLLVWFFADVLTALLLADTYQSAAVLLPWIAGGHVLLVVAQTLMRVAYARRNTQAALAVEVMSALAAVVLTVIGAYNFGLIGAAMVVPGYFGFQLLVTAYVLRRDRQQMALA